MPNPPNLFRIGAKELHQDAFLTWLITWGDPSHQQADPKLQECGLAFINFLICKQHDRMKGSVISVNCSRQWDYIDIAAKIRTTEANYMIIIEDKMYAGEHSRQLERYKAAACQFCEETQFEPVYIYLKSTSDSEFHFRKIREHGFAIINRHDLRQFMLSFPEVANSIYKEFVNWLQEHEDEHSVFRTLPHARWGGKGWQGFYEAVEAALPVVGWHYVNVRSGDSFWNLCLNWEEWDGFPVYIQIEQGLLCFKIATGKAETGIEEVVDRGQKRNEWHKILLSAAKESGLHEIRRPSRFGSGDFMTVACVDVADWMGNEDVAPDIQEVSRNLRKYMDFLCDCIEKQ
jgi:hypothetical protein